MTERHAATRLRVLIAFAAVYVIWGSTYLAIRVAIETLPPFLMAGTRFATAGVLLYAWARWRGAPAPTWRQWRTTTVVGAFLLLGGNGGVVWSEQHVPSGLAALLIATVPLWMAVLEWIRGEAPRPAGRTSIGLALGMLGVGLLVTARGAAGAHGVDPVGAAVLVLAALSWAWGSLHARRADLPRSPLVTTGMEMLCGGLLLVLAGLARGEGARLDLAAASPRSLLAFGYLVGFGSLLGFTAYIYLLGATTPTRATTYAFVNPLVAVLLGWALAGESLAPRALAAAAVIVGAVVLIVTATARRATAMRSVAARPAEVQGAA